MSKGFAADLTAETRQKDRWQKINRVRKRKNNKAKTRQILSGHKSDAKRSCVQPRLDRLTINSTLVLVTKLNLES